MSGGNAVTGAELVCDGLEREGVRLLFGHPGGAILPLYDALHRRPGLRHVLVRHEQAAAHAADGFARATGRTGVCLATSGPGATNLVTGLAAAAMDSVPLVALTGQVPTGVLGSDAFQETDILGITIPVTKHGFMVTRAADLPDVLREAFRLARSGRPGPVLVDIPKDVQSALVPGAGRESRDWEPDDPLESLNFLAALETLGALEALGRRDPRDRVAAVPSARAATNGRETRGATSEATADATPGATAGGSADATPEEATAETTPGVSTESTAEATPEPMVEAAPESTPEPTAEATAQVSLAAAVARAADLVRTARRPVLMVGRGVVLSGNAEAVLELAETLRLPVITTLLGLDAFPRSHPLALGMPGMHGTARANRAIQEADLVVGLGLRFDDRVTGPVSTFAPGARVVAFEVDPAAVGRTVRPHLAVVGDLRATLPLLRAALRARPGDGPEDENGRFDAWWDRLRQWPREAEPEADVSGSRSGAEAAGGRPSPFVPQPAPLGGREAIRALAGAIARSGAQVATDVGQHQMWLAQELGDALPGTHLTSGGLGAMGYALPAALGAALGRPDRPTWVVAGDGGFQMTLQELATVVQERIPLRIAVVNNGFLGMVRQWQELFYEGRYSASRLSGPDLCVLARAYGVSARRVSRTEALEEAVAWAESRPGPVLLDLVVREEEKVYPMVPPGAALHELVEAPVPAAGALSRAGPA